MSKPGRVYRGNIVVPHGRPVLNRHAGKIEDNIQATSFDDEETIATDWSQSHRKSFWWQQQKKQKPPPAPGFCSCGKPGLEHISWKCRQCWLAERHEQKMRAHRDLQNKNREMAERARLKRLEREQEVYRPRGPTKREREFLKVRDKKVERNRQEFAKDMRKQPERSWKIDKAARKRVIDAAERNGVSPEQARHNQRVRNQEKYVPKLEPAGNPGVVLGRMKGATVHTVRDPKDWEFDF